MGEHNVEQELDEQKLQTFMKALLDDLRALDYMLDNDLIESGVRRIGAEQEMFLVDRKSQAGSRLRGSSSTCQRSQTDYRDCKIQS